MKRFILVLIFSVVATFAFAQQDTWVEFEQKVLKEYPWAEYVAYEVYLKWEGDTEAFLQYLKYCPFGMEDDSHMPDAAIAKDL